MKGRCRSKKRRREKGKKEEGFLKKDNNLKYETKSVAADALPALSTGNKVTLTEFNLSKKAPSSSCKIRLREITEE